MLAENTTIEKHNRMAEKQNITNQTHHSMTEIENQPAQAHAARPSAFAAARMQQLMRRNNLFAACRPHHAGQPRSLTAEQRRQARTEMAGRLLGFLNVADRDNYYWVGSQRDLLELAYTAWLDGAVRDPQGRPIAFAALASRVCAKLHMPLPRNVYDTAAKARQRKGIVSDTLLNRYCFLRFVRGNDDPLAGEVIRLSV